MRYRVAVALVAAASAWCLAAAAPRRIAAATPPGLSVDRVVLLMRHGVRPPTKQPPMPAKVAAAAWPDWPVVPGWLTPHGAAAIARLGAIDAERLRAQGLLPSHGCPKPGQVAVIADSDQRTIATADAWLGALAPGCAIASEHKPQGSPDPLFGSIEANPAAFDVSRANAAVAAAAGPGGIAAVERGQRPLLARLDRILCGKPAHDCGVSSEPSAIVPAAPGKRPKLTGALDRASTAAQILLLEYAEGKPRDEVGWGRATAADIRALSAFHALEFRLLARPRYIAAANLEGLLKRITVALTDPDATAAVTMISGHDTQVANLGGLLGVHWHVSGFAQDDPAPGGALVLEALHDRAGNRYFRVLYRAQTLDQIRQKASLANGLAYTPLPIAGCHERGISGLCSLTSLQNRLSVR